MLGYTNITSGGMTASSAANLTNKTGSNSQWTNDEGYVTSATAGDVTLTGEQTLTNKTLTTPVINNPTGLDSTDVGLANVDNTSDATKNSAEVTLTNKTLTTPVINNPTGLDSTDVGLANVDNTSDATKNSAEVTLTNKTITPRVLTFTTDATPEVDSDDYDAVTITALGAAITDVDMVGTAEVNFQKLIFRIKDDGTARAIAWGSDFEAKGVALPTTTVISKVLTVGFIYDTVTAKWGCVASVSQS